MVLKKCDMKTFSHRCMGHRLVCYGIGGEFDRLLLNYAEYDFWNQLFLLVDNKKAGEKRAVLGRQYTIISKEEFLKSDVSNVVILITCLAFPEIIREFNTLPELAETVCYPFHFMFGFSEGMDIQVRATERALIPKTIHYCWFGGGKLPDLYKRCMESWFRWCPDYEIIEWNENNCDIGETIFTKQAYDLRKYGFVPDYFRLKIIYENGGIYLDTDVELLRELEDLRYNEAFCGMEYPGEVALGLGFGAIKGQKVIGSLMRRYKMMEFILPDGTMDETISPVYQTQDLMALGMAYGNREQNVQGLHIFPVEVLSPQNILTGELSISKASYAVHHYDGSWVTGERERIKRSREEKIKNLQMQFLRD